MLGNIFTGSRDADVDIFGGARSAHHSRYKGWGQQQAEQSTACKLPQSLYLLKNGCAEKHPFFALQVNLGLI